jgi:myo-inositol-1(or 4)-monophosphatase
MHPSLREPLELYRTAALEIAEQAGQLLLQQMNHVEVRFKGPKDLVTAADEASQQLIQQELGDRFPQHWVVGEEHADASERIAQLRGDDGWAPPVWVVDPLDGTVNFAHGLSGFAVSIALVWRGRVQVGVVYDPISRERFWAELGGGAWLDDQRLSVSNCQELSEALVAASFPAGLQAGDAAIAQFTEVLLRAQSLRRLGSAALNLCYLAGGRLDGYWASSVKSWDVAAGGLIAAEAGAELSDMRKLPYDVWTAQLIAASSPQLHQQLAELVRLP